MNSRWNNVQNKTKMVKFLKIYLKFTIVKIKSFNDHLFFINYRAFIIIIMKNIRK